MENSNTPWQDVNGLVLVENNVPYTTTRIMAEKLDIQHGPFMTNTVLKYQQQVEAKCGIIHFENGKIQGRGRPERYARLTELQTNAYLGLVKNTPQSVELKIDLAVAFDKAKKIIEALLNQQIPQGLSLQNWPVLIDIAEKTINVLTAPEVIHDREKAEFAHVVSGNLRRMYYRTTRDIEGVLVIEHGCNRFETRYHASKDIVQLTLF